MKILFFSYAYPNPIQPGLGTFNRSMISGLAPDHEIRVASPVSFIDIWRTKLHGRLPRGINDPQFSAVAGIRAEYLPYYYTPKVLRSQYGRFLRWSVRRPLQRTMKTFRPDIVLSYWAHPDGEVAVRTAHRFGVPAVVMVGGSDVLLLGRSGSRQQKILDVMQNADAIVTVSDDIARTLARDGVDCAKIQTVRRGVDRALFSPGEQIVSRRGLEIPEKGFVLVSAGRLVTVKGQKHLIEACRLLAARQLPVRCYILGDGPLRGELQKQINDLGLKGIVELKGGQSQQRLAEWYRAADVTVLPSLSEGVPNVLMESISCGTPFVASDVGGISEIADKRHDRLAPPACPVALADAIEWQLKVRPDKLPPRSFEPLALRAAARRLGQVLDSVRESATAISHQWQTFRPIETHTCGASPQEDALSGLQNSLSGASLEFMQPECATAEDDHWNPSRQWSHDVCLPSINLFSDELGRTGEEFVFPKKLQEANRP